MHGLAGGLEERKLARPGTAHDQRHHGVRGISVRSRWGSSRKGTRELDDEVVVRPTGPLLRIVSKDQSGPGRLELAQPSEARQLGGAVERVRGRSEEAKRTLEVTGVAAQDELSSVVHSNHQRLVARGVSWRRKQSHAPVAKNVAFTVQEMRQATAVDVRRKIVLSVDVGERRQPFAPLDHQFRGAQEPATSPVVKVQMTQCEDVNVADVDATDLESLGEMRTFWQEGVKLGSDREVTRGLVVAEVRVQPGVEDERGARVFDQVGRNREPRTPLPSFDEIRDVSFEPATTKTPHTHGVFLSIRVRWFVGTLANPLRSARTVTARAFLVFLSHH